jgi:spore coat protein U-like protein
MFSLLRKSVCFLCLGLCLNPAFAAVEMASMLVSVNVMPGCIITATPLVFGSYSPYAATSAKSISRLKVLCTLNTPYNIALDQGNGKLASTRLRTMSEPGGKVIRYILSRNPTYTINWGNTIGVDTVVGQGSGTQQYLIVYGKIPAKQNVGMGIYRDVVNVSIIF